LHNVLKTAALLVAGAVALLPLALGAQAAPPAALTRRQAIDTALARNPALEVARQQVDQAHARAVQAAAFPDPSVAGDLTGEASVWRPGSNTGSDLGVGLTVPFPTKFLYLHRVGRADVEAAQFAYEQLRQQTASETAQAYDALLVALQHQSDLAEGKQLAQEFLDKTRLRFSQGSVARLDVIKSEVDLAQVETALMVTGRDITNARARLNRLLGRLLGAPFAAADTLAVPDSLPDLTQLEATALAARPELHGLDSERAGARAAASLAKEFWLPDLDVSVTKNIAEGTPNSYTTAIGFSVPLFFWNHSRGEVAEASHHERELNAAYRDLEAQVGEDVETAYAAAATALQQAGYLYHEVVPEAREAYRIAVVSYGLGGSSALEVVDARRTLLDAEAEYADALGAANDARAELERAVGMPLDSLATGVTHAH
jgi:cobalt-zinc-cadmium efflux system outer membrane protein